jgi:hypothetical protein
MWHIPLSELCTFWHFHNKKFLLKKILLNTRWQKNDPKDSLIRRYDQGHDLIVVSDYDVFLLEQLVMKKHVKLFFSKNGKSPKKSAPPTRKKLSEKLIRTRLKEC